jgi:Putative zinc-finger
MEMEISCAEVRHELSNYIENDLTLELRLQIETHFVACPGCVAIYDGVLNVIRLVSDGRVIELPSGFSRRLYQRLSSIAPDS